MAVVNLGNQIEEWVQAALEKYALGTEVSWAGAFAIMPTQNGLVPSYSMNMIIPSIVLGETIQTLSHMPVQGMTEEKVHSAVKEIVDALLEQRSNQANLNGSSESSLIIPS